VALAIEGGVVRDGRLPTAGGWDAGGDAAGGECGAEAAAILAAVGDAFAGEWKLVQQQGSAAMIHGLAFGEQQRDRASLAVADGVEFRLPPALGAAEAAIRPPLLRRLAAVRCALRGVASIIRRSSGPPSAASAAKMQSNTLMRLAALRA
jgi:hypothetical protein